jgi:tetratricopeptide (TPR) repeat protein
MSELIQIKNHITTALDAQKRGNLRGAYEAYHQAFLLRLSTPELTVDPEIEHEIMKQLADLSQFFGMVAQADRLYEEMASHSRYKNNTYQTYYNIIKRTCLHLDQGNYQTAFNLLNSISAFGDIKGISFTSQGTRDWEMQIQWKDVSKSKQKILFTSAYYAMGWLLTILGQYKDAKVALSRGMEYCDSIKGSSDYHIPLRLRLTIAHLEYGSFDNARKMLNNLENEIDEKLSPGYRLLWLEAIGKLSRLTGDFGSAGRTYRDIVKICQRIEAPIASLSASINLANLLIFLNRPTDATIVLQNTEKLAQRLDCPDIVTRAQFLIYLTQRRIASNVDGVSIAPSVKEQREKWIVQTKHQGKKAKIPFYSGQTQSYLTRFEDRAMSFQWALGEHNAYFATDILNGLKSDFGVSDSKIIHLRLKTMDAYLAFYKENLSEAIKRLGAIEKELESNNLKMDQWQTLRLMAWAYRENGDTDTADKTIEQAQNVLEKIAATLTPTEKTLFMVNKWTQEEEMLVTQVNALESERLRIKKLPLWKRPLAHWRYLQAIDRLLTTIDNYKNTRTAQTLSANDADTDSPKTSPLFKRIWRHPVRSVTISFLVLPDFAIVFEVGWLRLRMGINPISRVEIRELVRQWHELIGNESGTLREAFLWDDEMEEDSVPSEDELIKSAELRAGIASQLSEVLQIGNITQRLPNFVKGLKIIPDDSLHGFPFAAFMSEEQYLIERFALSVTFEHQHIKRKQTSSKTLLGVAVAEPVGNNNPLPQTLNEINELERWATEKHISPTIVLNKEATPQTLTNHLVKVDLAHIASHGEFDADNPVHSGLILFDPQGQQSILRLVDLAKLKIKTQHITLSACWSADSFVLPGRWVVSLPETLCRAGSQSVLGSLWPVDDRVAVPFMQHFYNYLGKHSRDEALRRTQLDILAGNIVEGIDTCNPFYWASFVLYGDHKPLTFPKGTNLKFR